MALGGTCIEFQTDSEPAAILLPSGERRAIVSFFYVSDCKRPCSGQHLLLAVAFAETGNVV
jgi:hypothetical protein